MTPQEVRSLLTFLRRNGAFIEAHEDVAKVWGHTLRFYEVQAVEAGVMWFLERYDPRDASPAKIAAAVRSVMASGRVREPECADHPGELQRACRCCAADALTGDRPRALMGQRLHPPAPALTGGRPVTSPHQLRAVDPERWDRIQARDAAGQSAPTSRRLRVVDHANGQEASA